MADKYLNDTGLSYFYSKLLTKFQQQESGKGLSTNDYTTAEKTKLAGIDTGAQVNVIETVKKNGTALTVTNKAVDISVPTTAADITYTGGEQGSEYTVTVQTELNDINNALTAAAYDAGKSAFSNVKVGNVTIQADSRQDTLELAGSTYISITPNAANDKVTFNLTQLQASDVNFQPEQTSLQAQNVENAILELETDLGHAYAYANVAVGNTTLGATSTDDTITFAAGNNVTLTPTNTGGVKTVTIAATDTTYTPASANPLMDGTAAVGTSVKYAREDHVHPSDTSRVPTSRTVNGHALSSNVTVTAADIGVESGAQVNAVTDVQVNGTSVLSNKVANVPQASDAAYGVIKLTPSTTTDSQTGDINKSWVTINHTFNGTAATSKLPVLDNTNRIYYDNLPAATSTTKGAVVMDTAMSGTSTNAVQNSVIKAYVDNAVGAVVGLSFEIVQTLPASGSPGVIYLMTNSGTSPNVYDEYVWISSQNAFEKLGTTDIDLSGYMLKTDMVAITTSEIDTLFA